MFKLLTNYIRDQKTSLIQVFGLGFVVIIMVTSFLSLNFGTTYVSDAYWREIAHEEFHQDVTFTSMPRFKSGAFCNSWLENLNYLDHQGNVTEKITKASFRLEKLAEDQEQELYLYRFYFNDPDANIHVGDTLASETNRHYVDFQLSFPVSYPSFEEHRKFVADQAAIIDQYAVAGEKNKISFFLTNQTALDYYNSHREQFPGGRNYTEADIINQARLYQALIMGMLYGDNLTWIRVFYLKDLLITGKTMSFIQTAPEERIFAPILTDGNVKTFDARKLADDEILIYRQFAEENNLHIGQNYIFAGYQFKIAGFATNALVANNSSYFFYQSDNRNQTVAFVNQATMKKISANPYTVNYESDFLGFNPEKSAKTIGVTAENSEGNDWIYQYFHQKLLNNDRLNKKSLYFAINNAIDNRLLLSPIDIDTKLEAVEAVVWTSVDKLKDIFLEIGSTFLSLIFIVVAVIVFIIIFKMIDRNKRVIGILKAHGYQNWKLNLALVFATIAPMILFAMIGAALSVLVGHLIVTGYSTAIILISYGWPFYFQTALIAIFVPFITLVFIGFLMVAFLLRVNALTLISNNWAKSTYNARINAFFSELIANISKNFNFANKLAITTTFRGFGKMVFLIVVSIFASTLLLFSFSAGGLVNNLLGLQFASVNYKFKTEYNFTENVTNNFITKDKELLYKKAAVAEIKAAPSLYLPLKNALEAIINDQQKPQIVDFRSGYIMGSELYKIRKEIIEPQWEQLPKEFQIWWQANIYFIDYLTNDNGKNKKDLMINFGLLPYESELESPYTELNFAAAHDFNIDTIDTTKYRYNNETDMLEGDWSKMPGTHRKVNGVGSSALNYLNPAFKNSSFQNFTNLTLSNMTSAGGWLNANFLEVRKTIIEKFHIENFPTSSVKIIPMVGSTIPGSGKIKGGDGDSIGKTVLYRYPGLDGQMKYIIGVIYDGAKNLLQDTILMPEAWLNAAIFGHDLNLASMFANTKFTKFNESELHQYLPIISTKNDYLIDLTKLSNNSYLKAKGITPGLTMIYDVAAIKAMLQARQYSLQILIVLFVVFSILLSFMIIIIITNINIRDNLLLIEILRSLGYSAAEISYIFLVTSLPLLLIFALFAIFIAPILTGVIAGAISNFLSISVPIIFKWWYFALSLLFVLLIYFISYIITWSLNVHNKKLMSQTK